MLVLLLVGGGVMRWTVVKCVLGIVLKTVWTIGPLSVVVLVVRWVVVCALVTAGLLLSLMIDMV